jgi:hypothetical protein
MGVDVFIKSKIICYSYEWGLWIKGIVMWLWNKIRRFINGSNLSEFK